jgi:hypothetical protein
MALNSRWLSDEGGPRRIRRQRPLRGNGLCLSPDGEAIGFELIEQILRKPHRITGAEQTALEKYEAAQARAARSGRWTYIERPVTPQWDYEPTGQLVLTLSEGRWHDGMRRKFSDGSCDRAPGLPRRVPASPAPFQPSAGQGMMSARA